MATGIVATIALPMLAMLAGVGSMQATARDRELAARLAREVASSLAPMPGGYEALLTGGGRLVLPAPSGGESLLFAAFDAEGRCLGQVDEGAWNSGQGLDGRAFHLLRLRLSEAEGNAATPGPRLLEFELTVAQPATAPESARSRERFTSRLAAP